MAKICFLTSTINYGGATKILIEVANYLANRHEVSIMYYGNEDVSFYNIDKRIHTLRAPLTKCNIRKARLFTQMMLIRTALGKAKPDVVIAFGNTEKLMAVGASIGRKTKVIISERQDPFNYDSRKKKNMWLRYRLADGCVFQTEGAAKYFPKSVQEKSVVIHNFIDQDKREFIPIGNKAKTISYSARFELKQKRQDVMIEAFELVHQEHPEWTLVFYGDGKEQEKIERMVKEKGLEQHVFFAGKVSNVLDKIYESAIFVLSSDYEGIPNALLEAMGLGIPCVSTDCSPGGARLLIKDRDNGLLVPINDPTALAAAIKELILNPSFANKIGEKAVDVLETYHPSNILPQWEKYICKVVGIGDQSER